MGPVNKERALPVRFSHPALWLAFCNISPPMLPQLRLGVTKHHAFVTSYQGGVTPLLQAAPLLHLGYVKRIMPHDR